MVQPPKPPFDEKTTTFPADVTVSAFWWVGTTHIKADANMEYSTVNKGGIDVPVMRNTTVIEPFTKLARFNAKEAASDPYKKVNVIEGELPVSKAAKKLRKS